MLDEADQMLDMGFAKPISASSRRCRRTAYTALFGNDAEIHRLAGREPAARPGEGRDHPPPTTVDRIEQSVMFVDAADKRAALLAQLRTPGIGQAVVFGLQKNIADDV